MNKKVKQFLDHEARSMNLHTTNGESSSYCARSLKLTGNAEIIYWLELELTRMDNGH